MDERDYERHPLDLTHEERIELCKHLHGGPTLMSLPSRITVRHAISLQWRFERALPPYERPELHSPLWHAMMKIKRVAECTSVHHRNVHDMLYTMHRLGGEWVSMDNPSERDLGFARTDGSCRQAIYLCRAHEKWRTRRGVETGTYLSEEWDVPDHFRKLFWTLNGREEMARVMSTGDHLLKFHEEDIFPLLARYIENGGHF